MLDIEIQFLPKMDLDVFNGSVRMEIKVFNVPSSRLFLVYHLAVEISLSQNGNYFGEKYLFH